MGASEVMREREEPRGEDVALKNLETVIVVWKQGREQTHCDSNSTDSGVMLRVSRSSRISVSTFAVYI